MFFSEIVKFLRIPILKNICKRMYLKLDPVFPSSRKTFPYFDNE